VLTEAVARGLHKLMAYKDEYEVARLYSSDAFRRSLESQFEATPKLTFHLAPPLLAKRDSRTGQLQKRNFGAWMMTAFRVTAPLRLLRGTVLDPFGHTEERQAERALIGEYELLVDELLQRLSPRTLNLSVELASLPDGIRGFGHVKERNIRTAKMRWAALLVNLRMILT
jgi:indolepyruvate ferredoxin oxidoreductase